MAASVTAHELCALTEYSANTLRSIIENAVTPIDRRGYDIRLFVPRRGGHFLLSRLVKVKRARVPAG